MIVLTSSKNLKNSSARLFDCLIAACLTFSIKPCLAATRQFVSLQRTGPIWIMPPLSSEWQKLKLDSFDEGSLLRLAPGASIELKQVGGHLTAGEIEARLRIAEPLILRMDRQIFKNLRYQDYALDGIWNDGSNEEKEVPVKPLLSFAAAFVRHFLSLETAQELPKLKPDPEKSALESGQKISNISILSPQQDSLHFLDRKQVEIPLYWESMGDGTSFKIYVWPANDVKREATVTIKGNRYILNLASSGRYKLQISSVDHRFRSEVLKFEVDRPLLAIPDDEPLEKQFQKAQIKVTPSLVIQYPPDHYEIMSLDHRVDCLFVWSDKQGLQGGDEYKLIVQGEQSAEFSKVTTQDHFASLRLPAGSFRYFVMKQNKITQQQSIASPSHHLQIMRGTGQSPWSSLGRKIHEATRDELILIEMR